MSHLETSKNIELMRDLKLIVLPENQSGLSAMTELFLCASTSL